MTDAERIAELEAEVARLRAELAQERADTVAWLAQRGAGESKFVFFRGVRAAYRAASTSILCGEHRLPRSEDDAIGVDADA